jgi:hypothetical protein
MGSLVGTRGLLDQLASTNSVCACPANDIHASLPLLPTSTYFLLELIIFGIPPPIYSVHIPF